MSMHPVREARRGKVQTVLGLVTPEDLGLTQTHEHLLVDLALTSPGKTATERARWDQPITLANSDDARRHYPQYRQALQLLDIGEAIEEVQYFKAAGGKCIVEMSSHGLSRDPLGLQHISRATGLHVVMGGGYYVHEYHPDGMGSRSEDDIADEICAEFFDGVDGVYPGIIGELGLTWPVHPDERKALRAAVQAQTHTGLALSIHPGRHVEAPLDAIRIVEDAGGDLSRVIIEHIDRTLFSLDEMLELARTGCYLEFDLFGLESSYHERAPIDMPNDAIRVNYLLALSEAGFADRLVVGSDIALKVMLKRYGGWGYDHILKNVVPVMRRKGMLEEDLHRLFVANPARILALA